MIAFEEIATVDPKTASQRFLASNVASQHHWRTIDGLLSGKDALCLMHQRQKKCGGVKDVHHCLGDSQVTPLLVIVGFPCSPFSLQRSTRGSDRSRPQYPVTSWRKGDNVVMRFSTVRCHNQRASEGSGKQKTHDPPPQLSIVPLFLSLALSKTSMS